MKGLRWFAIPVCIGLSIGIGGYLGAQPSSTTQPSSVTDDIAQAQDAMRKLLEQGPPVTAPTLPGQGVVDQNEGAVRKAHKGSRGQKSVPGYVPSPRGQIKPKLLPEGHYIADRRGRLTNLNDSWLFVFESDGRVMADPPMKILPNRWLEKMEQDVAASHEVIIFRISGEITTYHGQNFILLRKVLMERETQDNFR